MRPDREGVNFDFSIHPGQREYINGHWQYMIERKHDEPGVEALQDCVMSFGSRATGPGQSKPCTGCRHQRSGYSPALQSMISSQPNVFL